MRINKYLSEAGVCSRRAADREIMAGHVRIGRGRRRWAIRFCPASASGSAGNW